MDKKCKICKEVLPFILFNFYKTAKGERKPKAICKSCENKKKREHWETIKDNPEIKKRAIKRASIWYSNHKDRFTETRRKRESTQEFKLKRKLYRDKNKILNPEYWRHKNKKDKVIRRSRELSAGSLSLSSLVFIECYNLKYFQTSSFTCEYCSSIIGNDYHLEHLIPLCKGGNNETKNLGISCSSCNLEKGSKIVEEYNLLSKEYYYERNNKFK